MKCSVPRGRRELHHLGGREQDDLDLAAGREVCGVRRRHEDGLPLRLRAHPRRQRGRQHPHRPRALLRPVPGLLQGAGTQLPGQNIPWLTKYLSPPRLARQSTAPRLSAPLSATPNPSCWGSSLTRTRVVRGRLTTLRKTKLTEASDWSTTNSLVCPAELELIDF